MSVNPDELKQQIEMICAERGLDIDEVILAIEQAISSAYRKEFGDKDKAYEVKFDINNSKYSIFEIQNVVEEVVTPGKEIDVLEAKLYNPTLEVGSIIRTEIALEKDVEFGRIASQVARQVLFQTINNTRHSKILQQFKDKIGQIVTVEIDFYKKNGYIVKLGQTQGYLGRESLLPMDRFKSGQTVKALILNITEDERGSSKVVLSRTHPDFVKAIIANETPEVESGIVIIDKIVRDPGNRTKILVSVSEDENLDPVGTILGRKNTRITNIMREITHSMQEKIDVIENQPNYPETMIEDALEPAEIERVEINEETKRADIFCYPGQASLAVGKKGVNIKLASELLGYELNIVTLDEKDIKTQTRPTIVA